MAEKRAELAVYILTTDSVCAECGEELERGRWIALLGERGALCLGCADLDHLDFLPAGDAALTRRSRKYSTLSAVVLKWSRARKRYERQGLLVETQALERAEQECLADSEVRALRRERDAVRRERLDQEYVVRFAERLRQLYPGCPPGTEQIIAEHACLKSSGRVGRSAVAKEQDADAIYLAVVAHIRHNETNYDELLMEGYERHLAREEVRDRIEEVLDQWEGRDASLRSA